MEAESVISKFNSKLDVKLQYCANNQCCKHGKLVVDSINYKIVIN